MKFLLEPQYEDDRGAVVDPLAVQVQPYRSRRWRIDIDALPEQSRIDDEKERPMHARRAHMRAAVRRVRDGQTAGALGKIRED